MTEVRTRRRGEELEHAILDAAWEELHEVGYAKLTIERVAARAGTSKPVIYRRWSGRAELVLAAWGRQTPKARSLPDSGSLRGDLITLFTRIAERVDAIIGEVIAGVMGEVFRDPEAAEIMRSRLRMTMPEVTLIVDRAIERGELPAVEVPTRIARLPRDLMRNEAELSGGRVSGAAITELVDDVYLPLLHALAQKS